MNSKQIEIGAVYRHRTSSIGFAQAVKVLQSKTAENPTTRVLVKCAWATEPTFQVFMYKHFLPRDLVRHNVEMTGQQQSAAKPPPAVVDPSRLPS